MALGALGYVGYGVESVAGTAVAPTKFLPVQTLNFEDANTFTVPEQIRSSRDHVIAMPAPYSVSGTMEMELIPLDASSLLKSAFCATVVDSAYAGGGYQHVMTPGSASSTFTFEDSKGTVLIMRHMGVRVNTLDIKAAFGSIVTATFGLEGTDRTKYTGTAATPTYATVNPFHFSGATVSIGGASVATVKDFSFQVDNKLGRIGTLRKTRAYNRLENGMRMVKLGLTLDFTDTVEYDRFLAATSFDVSFKLEGDTMPAASGAYTLVLDIPNVFYDKVNVPLKATEYLQLAIETTVVNTNGGNIFTATLVNTEPTVA